MATPAFEEPPRGVGDTPPQPSQQDANRLPVLDPRNTDAGRIELDEPPSEPHEELQPGEPPKEAPPDWLSGTQSGDADGDGIPDWLTDLRKDARLGQTLDALSSISGAVPDADTHEHAGEFPEDDVVVIDELELPEWMRRKPLSLEPPPAAIREQALAQEVITVEPHPFPETNTDEPDLEGIFTAYFGNRDIAAGTNTTMGLLPNELRRLGRLSERYGEQERSLREEAKRHLSRTQPRQERKGLRSTVVQERIDSIAVEEARNAYRRIHEELDRWERTQEDFFKQNTYTAEEHSLYEGMFDMERRLRQESVSIASLVRYARHPNARGERDLAPIADVIEHMDLQGVRAYFRSQRQTNIRYRNYATFEDGGDIALTEGKTLKVPNGGLPVLRQSDRQYGQALHQAERKQKLFDARWHDMQEKLRLRQERLTDRVNMLQRLEHFVVGEYIPRRNTVEEMLRDEKERTAILAELEPAAGVLRRHHFITETVEDNLVRYRKELHQLGERIRSAINPRTRIREEFPELSAVVDWADGKGLDGRTLTPDGEFNLLVIQTLLGVPIKEEVPVEPLTQSEPSQRRRRIEPPTPAPPREEPIVDAPARRVVAAQPLVEIAPLPREEKPVGRNADLTDTANLPNLAKGEPEGKPTEASPRTNIPSAAEVQALTAAQVAALPRDVRGEISQFLNLDQIEQIPIPLPVARENVERIAGGIGARSNDPVIVNLDFAEYVRKSMANTPLSAEVIDSMRDAAVREIPVFAELLKQYASDLGGGRPEDIARRALTLKGDANSYVREIAVGLLSHLAIARLERQ